MKYIGKTTITYLIDSGNFKAGDEKVYYCGRHFSNITLWSNDLIKGGYDRKCDLVRIMKCAEKHDAINKTIGHLWTIKREILELEEM